MGPPTHPDGPAVDPADGGSAAEDRPTVRGPAGGPAAGRRRIGVGIVLARPSTWRPAVDRFLALLFSGALTLSILTFISYVMGLLRDRAILAEFGASREVDAFKAAFVVPELSLSLVVASGLAAPFIPLYSALARRDPADAHRFAQTIATLAVLAMALVSGLLWFAAPLTAELVVPGFDPAGRALYVDLFRVMLLGPVLFAASIALGEILLAERRFLFYGLAPPLYNAGIVVGAVLLAGPFGIFGPAYGAVLGAAAHLLVRVVGARRAGLALRPRLAIRMPAVGEFVRLMLPKTGSSPLEPLTFLAFTNLASGLAAGSVTAVDAARNFQSVPVSLVGVAFSLAAFPTLSAAAAAGDRSRFVAHLREHGLTIAALSIAAALGLALVGGPAIAILLGGGRFDATAVERTALVLGVFALSVPFEGLGHLASRAIFATRHTLLQVAASLVGFVVTVGVAAGSVGSLGIVAIPTGFLVGSAVRLALLGLVLAVRIRRIEPPPPT
ncbi:MAG TPA: lipid II flippase MurJ [Candidatus Binatia bacterium]|nr:lipid II flippase MurJ [Candidatus Binatia bacterium]